MAGFFGGEKETREKTILIVDVENGSVGAALLRTSDKGAPRLFAETRIPIPLLRTRSSADLSREVEKATSEALHHTSLVAARIRTNSKLASVGTVSEASVFLGAPWSTLAINRKGAGWEHEPTTVANLDSKVESLFGIIPVSFHAFGTAALHTTTTLFEQQADFLLCAITGEIAELLLVQNGRLTGRATTPVGTHLLTRTLQSHAGISAAEAHSALMLARHGASIYREPFSAAASHFSLEFRNAAKEISLGDPIQSVLIIAPEPAGSWVAQALSKTPFPGNSVSDPFADGAVVRALQTHHLMPYLAAHGPVPDLSLMVEAIFVDGHINRI